MEKIGYVVILLTIVFAAHLAEEVKTGLRKKFPLGEIPIAVMVIGNTIVYLFAAITVYLAFKGHSVVTLLALIYGVVMLINATVHIMIMLIKRKYFPGGVTAFALLPVSIYLIIQSVQVTHSS